MARTAGPFPPPPRPAKDACGEMVGFYWGGEYEAHCIAPKLPRHVHNDGVAYSQTCSACGHADQHAPHPDGEGWPSTVLKCGACPDGKCTLPG